MPIDDSQVLTPERLKRLRRDIEKSNLLEDSKRYLLKVVLPEVLPPRGMTSSILHEEDKVFRFDPTNAKVTPKTHHTFPRVMRLLQLERPTQGSGKIYCKEVIRKYLKKHSGRVYYGEVGQEHLNDPSSSMAIDLENVALKVTDVHIEGDDLMGTVTPCGPKAHILEDSSDTAFIALRSLCRQRRVGNALYCDIVEIAAFDLDSASVVHRDDSFASQYERPTPETQFRVFPGDPSTFTDHNESRWIPMTEKERTEWVEGIGSAPQYRGCHVPTHRRDTK